MRKEERERKKVSKEENLEKRKEFLTQMCSELSNVYDFMHLNRIIVR